MNYIRKNPKFDPKSNRVFYPPGFHIASYPKGIINSNDELKSNLIDPYGMNMAINIINHSRKHQS